MFAQFLFIIMVQLKKSVISLKFKTRLTDNSLRTFSDNVADKVSTDPQFNSIAALATDELKPANTAYADMLKKAIGGSRLDVANKEKAREAVIGILNRLAQEVNIIADGDASVIMAAGFDVRKKGERSADDPGPVTDLLVLATLVEGEVKCTWTKDVLANKTAFEWMLDEPGQEAWVNGDYSDGAKLLIQGLPSKKYVKIRARSLASGNRKSAWSEPVRVFVY